jgi:C1A family cysteine protease
MRLLALRAGLAVTAGFAVAALGFASTVAAGPVSPAPTTQHQLHGLGLRTTHSGLPESHSALPVRSQKKALAAPASYDLSNYALPPGDQGQVGSCVAWANAYSGFGIIMHEQGISGSPMAPMYAYAQIAKGHDQGTWAAKVLNIAKSQGIDTKTDYWQGDFDYTTQPDATERANAAHYKLSGYNTLPMDSGLRDAVQESISRGMPVAVGLNLHKSFYSLNKTTAWDYTYMPDASDPYIGGHEMAIVAYNTQGVTFENSWGSNWGHSGYLNVSWTFLQKYVNEANAIGAFVAA